MYSCTMSNGIQAVIFDMDNTLLKFVEAKKLACKKVIEHVGCGDEMDLFRYFLRNIHGFEHHDNVRDYLNDNGVRDESTCLEACTIYDTVKLDSIVLYPGVTETLELLRSHAIRMAVVTDAESRQATARLNKLNIEHFFDCVITPDISGVRKPNPTSFTMALDRLQASPEKTWVVGDSLRREIEPGNALGMTTVHAEYGDWIGIPAPSIQPDFSLQAFHELASLMGLQFK
jgi:putative hydrolase of the HAD superfamily